MLAYELTTKVVATGVGTVVVIKIPVANLDWSPKEKEIYLNDNDKHIYMSFLHLDAGKTLNNTSLGWQSETVTLGENNRTIKVAPNRVCWYTYWSQKRPNYRLFGNSGH
nr:hypothetical protein [Mycoplasmopsis bovis]